MTQLLPAQVQFELFMKDCPKTAENFRQLCTGEAGKSKVTGKPLDYTGLTFHRIIPGEVLPAVWSRHALAWAGRRKAQRDKRSARHLC